MKRMGKLAVLIVLLYVVIQFAIWTHSKFTKDWSEFQAEPMTSFFVEDGFVFNITKTIKSYFRFCGSNGTQLGFIDGKIKLVFADFFVTTNESYKGINRLRQIIYSGGILKFITPKGYLFYDSWCFSKIVQIEQCGKPKKLFIFNINLPHIKFHIGFNYGENMRSFCYHKIVGAGLCCICAYYRSISGLSGYFEATLQRISLPYKCAELKESNGNEQASEDQEPPIVRRFFGALLSILICFGLSFWGINCLYNQRRLLGAALIACGLLLVGGALFLYWLSLFPATWGWYL